MHKTLQKMWMGEEDETRMIGRFYVEQLGVYLHSQQDSRSVVLNLLAFYI